MKKKKHNPEYRERAAILWLAEIIEEESCLCWDNARKLSRRLLEEIDQIPDLFVQ